MSAIDQLRATHRRATAADALEVALRRLVDVLRSDDLEGEALYDAIEAAVVTGCDALVNVEGGPSYEAQKVEAVPDRGTVHEDGQDERFKICRSCGIAKGPEGYSRNGKGPMKTCRECMSAKRVAQARRKKAAARKGVTVAERSDMAARRCHDSGELVLVCRCDRCIADRNGGPDKPPARKPEPEEPAVPTQTIDRAAETAHAPRPAAAAHPTTARPAVKPGEGDYGHPQPAPYRLELTTPDGRPAGGVFVPETTDPNWDQAEAAVNSAIVGSRVLPAGRSSRHVGRPLPSQDVA